MKLTTDQLKKIIKEELKNVLDEGYGKWGKASTAGSWKQDGWKDDDPGYETDEYGNPTTTAGLKRGPSGPRYSNSDIARLKRELTNKIDAGYAEKFIMDMYRKNPDDFQSHPYPRLRTDAEHDKFQRDLKQLDQRADDDLGRPWWKKMLGMDE